MGHGECLIWYNFCASRNICNMGFPPRVEVRMLSHPRASISFLAQRAPLIFQFQPHVVVLHLGMFDLVSSDSDPLSVADRLWHILELIHSFPNSFPRVKFIFIGQPPIPRHLSPDRMYIEWVDAFHLRLLRLGEGSFFFSIIFLADLL